MLSRVSNTFSGTPSMRPRRKSIRMSALSAQSKMFQRIWPLLVTVEITDSSSHLLLMWITEIWPVGAYLRPRTSLLRDPVRRGVNLGLLGFGPRRNCRLVRFQPMRYRRGRLFIVTTHRHLQGKAPERQIQPHRAYWHRLPGSPVGLGVA